MIQKSDENYYILRGSSACCFVPKKSLPCEVIEEFLSYHLLNNNFEGIDWAKQYYQIIVGEK